MTVRELAELHPEMYDYHYRWTGTENPSLEKHIDSVLLSYGYKMAAEDEEFIGEYNDLKGYLNCEIEKI